MTVPGRLDLPALAALSGKDDARMRHFHALDRSAQEAAVRRLHAAGHSDHGIARATGLAVEQIRRVLSEAA